MFSQYSALSEVTIGISREISWFQKATDPFSQGKYIQKEKKYIKKHATTAVQCKQLKKHNNNKL